MQRALLVPIQPRPRPAGRPQDLLKSRYATAQPVNIKELAPQQPLERLVAR